MKILQICNKIPYPPNDGGAIATFNTSLSFVDLGHKVTILTLNTKKHFFDLNNMPIEIKNKINFICVDIDTTLSSYKAFKNLLFSKLPYNAERFYSNNFSKKLIELLSKETFDIIQIEGLYMALYIDIITKYSNAIISLRAHNIEHEIWHRTSKLEKNILKKHYFNIIANRIKKLKKTIINKYDVLVPITSRDKIVFERFGNTKPCFIAQAGIDTSKLIPYKSNYKKNKLFHIGALDWSPNQEGLIWFINNVWKSVLNIDSSLEFHIAGRNCPDWLKKKFNEKNIIFHGEIDDAYKFINSNSIMIVPLFSGSGMRIKIIEGLALGKTIISTPIGAEGISVTDNENIIIAENAESFITSIYKLINNNDFNEIIGKNAVTFAKENYDNISITKSLIDFYQENIK